MHSKFLTILLFIPALFSCGADDDSNISSATVNSGGIYINAHVTSNGGKTASIDVQLTENAPASASSGDIFIDLLDGDELWASTTAPLTQIDVSDNLFADLDEFSNTQSLLEQTRVRESNFFVDVINIFINILLPISLPDPQVLGEWYTGQIIDKNDERFFRLSLLRPDFSDATETTVTLPENFSLTAPSVNSLIDIASNDIVIEWDTIQTETSVTIRTQTSCDNIIEDEQSFVASNDTGSYIIPAGTLNLGAAVSGQPNLCITTLYVTKNIPGTVDPVFVGGTIIGHQTRATSIQSTR